jgi:tungstate transport system ATP-binding protein
VGEVKAPIRQTLISLHDAGVSFGDARAVRGVTLSPQRGDRLMLVGANGSGKTTLIRLLHGLLQPDVAGAMQTHALVPEGRARELSGGQQQRLALARAWALQPDILFLDEPTASLDPGAKREVEALVQDFAADGVTLVMSTHNLGQARRLGTRVAYLEAGTLVVDRLVEDFFSGDDLPDPARQFLKGELPWHT